MVSRKCQVCGKPFTTHEAWIRKGGGKTCSHICSRKLLSKRKEVVCQYCGEKFILSKADIDRNRRFCDLDCYYLSRVSSTDVAKRSLAHNAVNNALYCGDITRKPCYVCGNKKAEAHHPDYDKPLDIVWLCRKHHIQLHSGALCLILNGPRC